MMPQQFTTKFLEEPDLVFGGQREEKDPKLGLKYLGPYHYSEEKEPSPGLIKVGIIGDSTTLTLSKTMLEVFRSPITSPSKNKWLYPDFPGFNNGTPIKCDFSVSQNWEIILKESEIKRVLNISDSVNRRIAAGVNLFRDAVRVISSEDDTPHVIVCALPHDIEEFCGISEKTRGAKRPKFTALERIRADLKAQHQGFLEAWGIGLEEELREEEDLDLDFHNALKGKIMEFGIPVQVLRESSLRGMLHFGEPGVKVTQEPATFAWNLATELYYKSNGKPWRLAKLRQDTCYVGISFFHNKLNPDQDVQTSMAQVFTHNGEGIVLRGTDVTTDERTKQVHMSERQTFTLISESLRMYFDRAKRNPSRVVIHKTSEFSEAEKKGVEKAVGEYSKDMITIRRDHTFRFLRSGSYPVLRGTMISLSENKCFLYTSGYIPRIRTYPGNRIPEPLMISKIGDSELLETCKEIMGLTKLNWNTTSFATALPITLEFSRRVGNILSELDEEAKLQNHYRFYM
ncbi:MAG: hypothetical protein PXY39_12915 [archaeon]|nr:hypothetical protein [archaeon]